MMRKRNHQNRKTTLRRMFAEQLEQRSMLASDLPPLVNIVPGTASSSPGQFAQVGGQMFFTATTSIGLELWKSDGTAAGTSLVKDVRTGSAGSAATYLTNVNGTLFFSANDGVSGPELWKSDGTSAGTVRVKDIRPGANGADLWQFVTVGNQMYFTASDTAGNYELWISNGTDAGTFRVKDINPGSASSDIRNTTNFNGRMLFSATDGTTGSELWISDGTSGGTFRLQDIRSGASGSELSEFTVVGNHAYFVANDGSNGLELWRTDGTAAGTSMVKNIAAAGASSNPLELTNVDGKLYFTADDGASGRELWTSDGTTTGTTRVSDIQEGATGSTPQDLVHVAGELYFTAVDGIHGRELWTSDGTASGTRLVRDIVSGSLGSAPLQLIDAGGRLYFSADDGVNGRELWTSDGTTLGTNLLLDISSTSSNPTGLQALNGGVFFSASTATYGSELYFLEDEVAPRVLKSSFSENGVVVTGTTTLTVTFSEPVVNATNPANYRLQQAGTDGLLLTSDPVINPTTVTLSGNVATLTFATAIAEDTYRLSIDDAITDIAGNALDGDENGTAGGDWREDWVGVGGTTPEGRLVSDINSNINPINISSLPKYLVAVGDYLYFTASTSTTGAELWRSDGTVNGTTLVKDIGSGANGSYPENLTNINGTLYFAASGELWKSDGTTIGTTLVKDIRTGSRSSSPRYLTNVNGTLYFIANDGTTGFELWKSDGTTSGTTLIKDIRTGANGSNPSNLTNVNGALYFVGNDGSNGEELWKSDGTTIGTTLVKDIRTGSSGSSPRAITNVNGTLFFSANDGTNGFELWKSNGTTNGTILVKDIRSGTNDSIPSFLTNVNSTLYFAAFDDTNGFELWKSDGTNTGTTLVKNIRSGAYDSNPSNLTNVNGTLYFNANDGISSFELWKSDGTSIGTTLVKDIRTGTNGSNPRNLTNVNGTFYFTAFDDINGDELWKSDGTTAGTTLVKDISSGTVSSLPIYLTNVNGTFFFRANDGTNGVELWKSNGTANGTSLVKDLRNGASNAFDENFLIFTNVNGTLYFRANDGSNGFELWKSDGTKNGTALVKDIRTGAYGSNPRYLTNVNGTLYFIAYDDANGYELWKSDGTATGSTLVKDIRAGNYGSNPRYLTNVNGTLYFRANDGINGEELWKSDGTTNGTTLVRNIRSGSNGSSPSDLINVNGTLYFGANDGISSYELWKSDGTTTGTTLVKDVRTGTNGSSASDLINVNGTVYFIANDGINGYELWKSDGTTTGTTLVKDIRTGANGSYPSNLTIVNGTLYFSAGDDVNGGELWKSDGTNTGTILVKNIRPGASSSSLSNLTNVNDTLYFRANDGSNGYQLWKSDGTESGTTLVKDIRSGTNGSNIGGLTNVNGTLYFIANDGINGYELWKSDGTASGTGLAFDATPVGGSNPVSLTVVGSNLFFAATTDELGTELFVLDVLGSPKTVLLENAPHSFVIDLTSTDAGQLVHGTNNAFDGLRRRPRRISDGNFEHPGSVTMTDGDRTVVTASATMSGLSVQREVTVPNTGSVDFARNLDVFTNSTANPITVPVRLFGNLGSDEETTVFATSDGDLLVEPTDSWFATDDADPDGDTPAIVHLFRSPFGLMPDLLSVQEDNVDWTFNLTVAPGATQRLATFTILGTTRADALRGVQDLLSPTGFTGEAAVFLSAAERDSLANFVFNLPPTDITLSSTSIPENVPIGTNVGTFSTSDPNPTDTFTYAFASGSGDTHNNAFTISGDNLLTNSLFNFESQSSYSIRVRSTDPFGASFEKSFLISITDVNEAPTISLSNVVTNLDENTDTSSPIRVADIVVTDDALGTNMLSLTGANAGSFEITDRKLYLKAGVALNFESLPELQAAVQIDDSSVGSGIDQTFTFVLRVHDVNEAPTINLSNVVTHLDENTDTSSPIRVADIVVTDDALGTNSLSLTGDHASSFEITDGKLYLKSGVALNFEALPELQAAVQIDDSSVGPGVDQTFTFVLRVDDVNEAPTISLSNVVTHLDENTDTSSPIRVANIVVTDDALGTNSLSLTGDHASSFEITDGKLYLKAGVTLNFEALPELQAAVQIDDSSVGPGIDQTFTFVLRVDDVNEAPTISLSNVVTHLDENTDTSSPIRVADIVVADDALGINSLSLTGTHAGSFEITDGKLYLKSGVALNFEWLPELQAAVQIDDSSVGPGIDQTFTFVLRVDDVNEAPTISLSNVVTHLDENTDTSSPIRVADIVITDDALGTNSLSLTGDHASSFEITDGKLYLKSGVALNYEALSQLNVTVQVDDPSLGGGAEASVAYSLSVYNLAEAPTDILLSNASLPENLTAGVLIGTLSSIDTPDSTSFTYALVSGAGETHNNQFTIVGNELRAAASFDFELLSQLSIRVRSTNLANLSFEKALTLSIVDQPEGTTGNDAFTITYSSTNLTVTRSTAGGPAVQLGSYPAGVPFTLYGLAGTDSVRLLGTTANDLFDVWAGAIDLNGTLMQLDSVESKILVGNAGNDLYRLAASQSLGSVRIEEAVGGIDTLDLTTSSNPINLNLASTTVQNVTPGLQLQLQATNQIENALGGSANDWILGNALDNLLSGGDGDDRLEGLNGNDRLEGAAGNDQLLGGSGDDRYLFDADSLLGSDILTDSAGIDTLDFSATTSQGITLSLAIAGNQTANGNLQLSLGSATAFEGVVGTQQADVLTGNSLANSLEGAGGNDQLNGGSGNDTYVFKADQALGTDTLSDASGIETLDFSQTLLTGVTVDLSVAGLQVINSNLSLILGSAVHFDWLVGSQADDFLYGNSLANQLTGSGGNDRLEGRTGNDTYLFDLAVACGTDTIKDTGGVDQILLFEPIGVTAGPIDLGLTTLQVVHPNLSLILENPFAIEGVSKRRGVAR